MRKKYVLQLILLSAIALLFAVFGTGCTNKSDSEQLNNKQLYESFLYERDFPNFTEPYDWSVRFDHDELLDAFNFIADYWGKNPYCDIINAVEELRLCVMHNRVRVGIDSDSEVWRVAFRTHVLDSRVIALEDGGMGTFLTGRIYNSAILFGTEEKRPNRAQLYNDQQEYFSFAELRDTLTAVTDFIWADRLTGQDHELITSISLFYLCVINNRVIVRLLDYSNEVKEAFRAKITDSPAISFVEFKRGT